MFKLKQLHDFIVAAKAATYVGDGSPAEPCRPKSHDLVFTKGDFSYRDSYFGSSDFIGEEVIYNKGNPVWGMNYYGVILQPEKIDAAEAGKMIKASLSRLYAEGRFLGGWHHQQADLTYYDTSTGDLTRFTGQEWIEKAGEKVYKLVYHGGLIH
jgi:hypothetical protein